MASYLCITIRFLQPYCHGRTDGGEPEWPPSPLRMFQALVAAAGRRWPGEQFTDRAAPALRWLEQLPPPSIVGPVGIAAEAKHRLYVPDNVADKVARSWSAGRVASIADYRTEKDVRPTRLQGDTVHFLFQLPDDGCPCLRPLTAMARSMTHVGWGVDMVAGDATLLSADEAAKVAGERWHAAADASGAGYRVPITGTLDGLLRKYEAFLARVGPDGFRPVSPLSEFRVAAYRRTIDVPGRRYAAFRLLHPERDRAAWFSPTRANAVAAMLRHATAAAAHHRPQEWIDSYVHGHRTGADDRRPRFSYLPLPTIEHRGDSKLAIGGIRRAILAELSEGAESHRLWAQQLLPGQFLTDVYDLTPRAMLAPLHESDWVLQRYAGWADTWATVTPVVLPGSDDGRFAKAKKLFVKSLGHAGYPAEALADAPEFRNVSFWPGGDLALRFQRPDYLRTGHWSVYHIRLRWKQPIKGPLALGAGRHCGLGIFAQMRGA